MNDRSKDSGFQETYVWLVQGPVYGNCEVTLISVEMRPDWLIREGGAGCLQTVMKDLIISDYVYQWKVKLMGKVATRNLGSLHRVHRPELTRQSDIWIDRYKVLFKCHLKMWCSQGRDRYNSLVHGNRQQMWVGSQGGKLADISSLISCVVSIISPPSVSLVSWMHVCVSANLTVFAGDNEELGLDLYFLLWTVFGGVCPRGPALDLIPRLGIRLRMYNVNVVIITHVLSKPNVWTRILNQNCSISITSCLLVTRFIHATVCGCGGQL